MSVPSAGNTVYAPFFVRSVPDEWLHVRRAATNDLHGAKKSGTREQRGTVRRAGRKKREGAAKTGREGAAGKGAEREKKVERAT